MYTYIHFNIQITYLHTIHVHTRTDTAVILRADAGRPQPLAGPIYPSFKRRDTIAARLTAGGSALSRVMHAVGSRRDRAEGAHPPSYIRRQQLAPFWAERGVGGSEEEGRWGWAQLRSDWDWEEFLSLSGPSWLLSLTLSLLLPLRLFRPRDRAYGGQIGISLTFEGLRRRGGSTPPKITTPCPRVSALFLLAASVPRTMGGLSRSIWLERTTPLPRFCFRKRVLNPTRRRGYSRAEVEAKPPRNHPPAHRS